MSHVFDYLTRGTDISIISTHHCKYCDDQFILTSLEKELYDRQGFCYPDHCPKCNFRLLYAYINDSHLYYIKDSFHGNTVISTIYSGYPGKIMEAKEYKKQILDDVGLQYAQEIGEDIFAQFDALYEEFPKPSRLLYPELYNAEYASHVGWSKDLYMSFCVFNNCEEIYNSLLVVGGSKRIFNSHIVLNAQNIYASHNIEESTNVFYGYHVGQSSDLLYCYDMANCHNCMFCCNQVNASYKVFNKQYTKEEYEVIAADVRKKISTHAGYAEVKKQFESFIRTYFVAQGLNGSRCEKVVGENVYNSKNCVNCYTMTAMENGVNALQVGDTQDDVMKNILNSIETGTFCHDVIGSCSFGGYVSDVYFSFGVVQNSSHIYYGYDIESCEECMFCVGLKSKKYCILNKQYEKEEYFEKKAQIIATLKQRGQWGKSMKFTTSVFPYNDTMAYNHFKIHTLVHADGREEVIDSRAKGRVTLESDDFVCDAKLDLGGEEHIPIKWRTKHREINIPEGIQILKGEDIPEIGELDESICDAAIICEKTGRPFRILKQEFELLKKQGLPLRRLHHEAILDDFMSYRSTGEMFLGNCSKCGKEMLHVHIKLTDTKYCKECYQEFMYK